MAVESTAVDQLSALLSQQLQAMAEERQEAREREARPTERLLQLTSTATTQQETKPSQQSSNQPATSRLPSSATPAPRLFSGASLREFSSWKDKYDGYCLLTGIKNMSSEEKKAALFALLDDEWLKIVKFSLNLDMSKDTVTTEMIVDKMEKHLRKQRNIIIDRREFYTRSQEPGESFNDFMIAVKEIYQFCDFCTTCRDEQIRDKIVTGIRDSDTLEELLATESLTLSKAVSICQARENAQSGREKLHGLSHSPELFDRAAIARVSPGQRGRGRSGQSAIARRCSFCGGPWHIQLSDCPAKNNVCELCSKRGHLAVACRSDRSVRPRVTDPPRPGSVPASGSTQERRPSYHRWSQGDHLRGIMVADVTARDSSESRRAPEIKIPVVHRNGSGVLSWIPDTGAESTVIGPDLVETIGGNLHNLAPTNHTLFSADGTELRCLGTIQAVLRLGPSEVNTPIFVVDGVRSALLSWFHATDLGILPACFPQPTLSQQDIKHHQETEAASSLPETTDDCMTPAPEANPQSATLTSIV